ncbi:MAG: cytochrome C [Arcobacteraceae bacterium]|nr:cytochrome C [Arcobacteraceae bacterium]
MKRLILTLAACATIASANDTTINATMDLMEKGMNDIQKGFFYNQKSTILDGTNIVINANKIFDTVDIKSFTYGNRATQAISNIHGNLDKDLKNLKISIKNNNYAEAAVQYGKVLNDCVACHTVIRGW